MGGILSFRYVSFLMLIIAIWWMSLLEELRCVADWWVVIIMMPSKLDRAYISRGEEGNITVHAIPLGWKVFTIVANLLPRSCICILLALAGTDFLVSADDCGDLILNSVALGFLITIDEMLYNAVVFKSSQKNIDDCDELTVYHDSFAFGAGCIRYRLNSVGTVAVLATVAVPYYLYNFYGGDGKYAMGRALACLCHLEGTECVTAQILGGSPFVG